MTTFNLDFEITDVITGLAASLPLPKVPRMTRAIAGVREELLAGGFDDSISKPLKEEELSALPREWLPPEKIVVAGTEEGAA